MACAGGTLRLPTEHQRPGYFLNTILRAGGLEISQITLVKEVLVGRYGAFMRTVRAVAHLRRNQGPQARSQSQTLWAGRCVKGELSHDEELQNPRIQNDS